MPSPWVQMRPVLAFSLLNRAKVMGIISMIALQKTVASVLLGHSLSCNRCQPRANLQKRKKQNSRRLLDPLENRKRENITEERTKVDGEQWTKELCLGSRSGLFKEYSPFSGQVDLKMSTQCISEFYILQSAVYLLSLFLTIRLFSEVVIFLFLHFLLSVWGQNSMPLQFIGCNSRGATSECNVDSHELFPNGETNIHHPESLLLRLGDVTPWDLWAVSTECILKARRRVFQILVTRGLDCGNHWSYSQLYSSCTPLECVLGLASLSILVETICIFQEPLHYSLSSCLSTTMIMKASVEVEPLSDWTSE